MRINSLQERICKPRKLAIHLQADTGSQEGKSLKQSLYIRIGTDLLGFAIERKTCGYFWKLSRKFPRHLPKMAQFAVIIRQQTLIHEPLLSSYNGWTQDRAAFLQRVFQVKG